MATVEEARRFLKGYRKAVVNIESLKDENEGHRSKLYSVPMTARYSDEGGCSSVASDKMGDDVAEYVDYKQSIKEELRAFVQIREDVHGIVRRTFDVNEKWGLSLHYRYIDWLRPTVVANEMDCLNTGDERGYHRDALKYVANMFPDTIERDLALLDSMSRREERKC